MSKPVENTGSDESLPELKDKIPLVEDVKTRTKRACDAPLPVDVLLLTVKNYEFLACYMQLSNPYSCWFDKLGYVYFEDVTEGGNQDKKVKVALLTCCEGSSGPGSSIISVTKAVSVLRPKAVISVGACSGLNTAETKLGDVVVSAKLICQSTDLRSCVSSRFLRIIRHSGFGWKPPLKEPNARRVQVHCDGEFLSGPQEVRAKWRCEELAESHPQAIAIEMEGEGLFTAAFDDQIEWLIVKGIADYADGDESVTKSWSSFASVMAASVVSHILRNPDVFRSWPHYADPSESTSKRESTSPNTQDPKRIRLDDPSESTSKGESSSRITQGPTYVKCGDPSESTSFKRESTSPNTQDPKRIRLDDSTGEFLKWCQDQLCSFYNTSPSQVMISPWDPDNTVDIDEVYVELSFVRDERKPTETAKKRLQDYCQIFDGREPHMIPKRILVYGRPGIGKSTFTKKLAVDWSRGNKEALKRFEVLVLVKLRDVCNTQDLCSVLKNAELLSADNPAVFDQLYDYVLQNQRKVLLVLDGFDEYSAEKAFVVDQIWRGSRLRDCSVLVTTRPTRDAELRPNSHAQFEINGFNKEQIKKFALKYLQHKDLSEFMEFLSQRDLWDMAEVPLLLLMLCLTWREKNQEGLPTSRAEVYERFFETLFDHLEAKFPREGFKSVDEYKQDLSKLGKIAFDALLEDCLYVKLSHLPEDIRPLIHELVQVGFFQISKLSSSRRPKQVVCFLHKSFQEYIAACYIVQELRNEKKESPACLPKVDSFDKVQKVVEVLKFACGLSSEAARAVLSYLQIIGEKEGLTECRLSETPHVEDLSDDQRVFRSISLDFVLSCPALDREALWPLYFHAVNNILVIDTDSQLTLVARDHALRFSVLPESCYLLFKMGFNFKDADELGSILNDLETVLITCYGETVGVPDDFYSVGLESASLFLKREGQQMMLCFSGIDISVKLDGFNLLRALTSAPDSPPEKRVDHLPQNEDNSEALHSTENTSVVTVNHSLSFSRRLMFCCERAEELTIACNVLRFMKRARMIIAIGSSFNLRKGWNDFAENLRHLKEVTELDLRDAGLQHEEGQLLNTAISHLCKLLKLDLSENRLGRSVIGLAKHLPSLPHLTELNLSSTVMGKEEVIVLARSLPSISKLEELYLSDNPLGQGVIELAQYLTSVPHLTRLDLSDTQMGEEEVIALARSLPSISKLEKLNLSRNPLGQGVIELAQYLTSVPHLTKLHLSNTQMGEEEAGAVVRALKDVCELEVLDLCGNPLGRGVSELIQHLSSVPQLRHLYLSDVKMSEKEASELCTAVRGTNISKLHSDYAFHSWRDDELTKCAWAVYDDSEEPGGGDLAPGGSPGCFRCILS